MRRRHGLLAMCGIGVFALFAWNVAASGGTEVGLTEDAVSAAALVALWIGVRRASGRSRLAWALVAAGLTCWVVGDFVWDGYALVGANRPDVSIADVWYLLAYPLIAAGLFVMARARAGRYLRESLLDACIFAVSAAVVVWQFLVVPIATTSPGWWTSLVWSSYPLGDVLLLAAVVWLIFAPGRRSAPSALLVSALVTTLIVDVLYSYLPSVSSFDTSRLDPFYPIAYALIAAAALHPSSGELTNAGPVTARIHPARFGLLGGGLCGAAIVAVGTENTASSTRYVYLALALFLCVTVVVRFAAAIRARETAQSQLLYRSTHDELTGVVNRVLLLDRIDHALTRAQRPSGIVAVLYLDLDHFKVINDTYGHAIGDELLVATAQRIQAALRTSDTVGRIGGDEFVIACEDISVADAVRAAERLVYAIAQPITLATLALQVTASVGIAISDDGLGATDGLVRDADTAMYEVKRRGGNSFELYDARIRDTFQHRREIETALRDATATGELVLHYQPVVRPATDTVVSFEALLRWQRVNGTLLPPSEFISIAEETGAIVPIGSWVIDTVCHKLASWALDGIADTSVSLNVSALQFRNGALTHDLKRALARTGADPTRLILEITESVLVREDDHVVDQLETIRRLGVRIALDDFGTGYSGLSYLHRLPVDIIKIDRSLTSELDTDPAASIVVAALIDLAHALGFQVVAEGAETEQQVARLEALECDQVQGYYYARPTTSTRADAVARHGLAALAEGSTIGPVS
jgi:diguanylate cyclase (GGDEF)-like protein